MSVLEKLGSHWNAWKWEFLQDHGLVNADVEEYRIFSYLIGIYDAHLYKHLMTSFIASTKKKILIIKIF